MIAIAILNIASFVHFNYIIHSDHRTGIEPVSPGYNAGALPLS